MHCVCCGFVGTAGTMSAELSWACISGWIGWSPVTCCTLPELSPMFLSPHGCIGVQYCVQHSEGVSGMSLTKPFLLAAALGLTPIALSYGVAPGASLSWLFDVPVEGTNATHIFRAIMGLYLFLAAFWVAGAINAHLTRPALWSLVIFMLGLASGRLLSLVVDGIPSAMLILYLVLELIFGLLGLALLRKSGALPAN